MTEDKALVFAVTAAILGNGSNSVLHCLGVFVLPHFVRTGSPSQEARRSSYFVCAGVFGVMTHHLRSASSLGLIYYRHV